MKDILQRMVSSGLNDVVGGGDPQAIGQTNTRLIEKMASIKPGMRVLDFGCGCGRVALPLLKRLDESGSYVGIDIIPAMIQFCEEEIAPRYSNAEFIHLQADNSHYTKWLENQGDSINSVDSLARFEPQSFDLIFAFSVFTHLGVDDTKVYLQQIASLLKPNGKALLSVLFINHSSRAGNKLGLSNVPFGRSLFFRKDAYFGNSKDKLASVAFRESTFIRLAVEAGLDVLQIYYGSWSGRRSRESYQDIILLEPRPSLPKNFNAKKYIQANADLPFDPNTLEGQKGAKQHYLSHGYFEGRRVQ